MADIEQVNTPELELAQIDTLVNKLNEWETRNLENSKVKKALQITHQIIDGPYQRLFNGRNVLITYHGSLLYNDPHQLDIDLVFTTDEEYKLSGTQRLVWQLEGDFERVKEWPSAGDNEGSCDTDFSTFSMENLREEVLRHEQEGTPYDPQEDIVPLFVSFLLTSRSLYTDEMQTKLLGEYKTESKKLLSESHLLRKEVIKELKLAIAVREQRSAPSQ